MATQKQRRRRAKEKRHEYDLVEIDAEGNETVVSSSAARETEPRRKAEAKDGRRAAKPARGVAQPPSWQRVAKRGALFGPIFLAVVMLLGGGKVSFLGAVVNTVFLLAVFIPFSYFVDSMVWRSYVKRNPGAAKR